MPEQRQIGFTYRELAELMVKNQGIHEGLWGVFAEFGIAAANISSAPDADALPTAIVPVQRLGIQRFDTEIPGITIDAAEVNPAAKS